MAVFVNFVGLAGLIASFFSIIYAYSRQIFALSRAGYLPKKLSLTNKNHAPHLAIIIPGVIGFMLSLSGEGDLLILMAVFALAILFLGAGAAGADSLKESGAPLVDALKVVYGENTWLAGFVNFVGLAGLIASFFSIIYAYSRQILLLFIVLRFKINKIIFFFNRIHNNVFNAKISLKHHEVNTRKNALKRKNLS